MRLQKALFLDRDGTLIRDVHYLKDPQELEIIQGIGESLIKAKSFGYYLFLHTNQSGISRGYYELSDVNSCNDKMLKDFGWPIDFFTEICIAPESPDDEITYRKPSPRFENEMAEKFNLDRSRCWMIGDRWSDAQTGINAGMKVALVKTGKQLSTEIVRKANEEEVSVFNDISEFVEKEIHKNE